jgi:hypothetical protein
MYQKYLHSIIETAFIVHFEIFQTLRLPQMQSVEKFRFGIATIKRSINVLDAILIELHVEQGCRPEKMILNYNVK